ncbi:MAG: adenosine kinase [Bacteroidales bacterium]|nr:adenosine kinase [Bacteroidales bacterium]
MKKIIGIGNALVDILVHLQDDSLLAQLKLPKGSMQLVDEATSAQVKQKLYAYKKDQASGGSAANTIHGIARLGAETAYIGKVGNDELGRFFTNDLEKSKIKSTLLKSATPTGSAVALISPDSERTFATYLGAAVEMSAAEITADMFEGYDFLHLEGYLVFNNELIEKAARVAKEAGLKISLDLASYNVVEANLDFLTKLTKQYIDIVFANEEEAKAFTGKEPEEALHAMADMCEVAVVKVGAKGSLVKQNGQVTRVGAIHCKPIDTTGAGDLYAGGFLYGFANGYSMQNCGKLGALLAGKVIEVTGAKIPENVWDQDILPQRFEIEK